MLIDEDACKECKKDGHNKRTCPELVEKESSEEESESQESDHEEENSVEDDMQYVDQKEENVITTEWSTVLLWNVTGLTSSLYDLENLNLTYNPQINVLLETWRTTPILKKFPYEVNNLATKTYKVGDQRGRAANGIY